MLYKLHSLSFAGQLWGGSSPDQPSEPFRHWRYNGLVLVTFMRARNSFLILAVNWLLARFLFSFCFLCCVFLWLDRQVAITYFLITWMMDKCIGDTNFTGFGRQGAQETLQTWHGIGIPLSQLSGFAENSSVSQWWTVVDSDTFQVFPKHLTDGPSSQVKDRTIGLARFRKMAAGRQVTLPCFVQPALAFQQQLGFLLCIPYT